MKQPEMKTFRRSSAGGVTVTRNLGLSARTRPYVIQPGATGITAHTLLYNVNRIRYPWKECILSALPACDEFVACECFSDDGTHEDLLALAAAEPKIRIIRKPWGPHCEVLSKLTNACIEQVRTPFHLQIQADEVLHESSLAELLTLPRTMEEPAAWVNYSHFVGDFDTVFPFIYSRTVRFARTKSVWRSGGDACSLGGPGAPRETRLLFCHYGKVHVGREAEAAHKEYKFHLMFQHLGIGFPDPLAVKAHEQGWIDYREVFPRAKAAGEFQPFLGTHPAVMEGYIREAKERARAWEASRQAPK